MAIGISISRFFQVVSASHRPKYLRRTRRSRLVESAASYWLAAAPCFFGSVLLCNSFDT